MRNRKMVHLTAARFHGRIVGGFIVSHAFHTVSVFFRELREHNIAVGRCEGSDSNQPTRTRHVLFGPDFSRHLCAAITKVNVACASRLMIVISSEVGRHHLFSFSLRELNQALFVSDVDRRHWEFIRDLRRPSFLIRVHGEIGTRNT